VQLWCSARAEAGAGSGQRQQEMRFEVSYNNGMLCGLVL
jgi:hypothetical protein